MSKRKAYVEEEELDIATSRMLTILRVLIFIIVPILLFYLMEAFELAGMTSFTTLYGGLKFECTKKEYHENGRISKLVFEIIENKTEEN